MSWTKEEMFRRIRHDSLVEGLSIRALARKHGVHRRLVREALSSPVPRPRRTPARTSPRLDPFKKIIDEWLRADLDAPPKQRHTTKRIAARLVEEHDARVSYTTVRDYVAVRRPQIAAEAGAPAEGFIIRHNRPGADAEVDFGEVAVDLAGVRTRCYLFAFRLAYSGRAVHRITLSSGQDAFLEGHVHAFTTIGGIPTGQIRYDNLTPAVQRVVFHSRSRVENPRWRAFREYYGFTPFYCEPGLRGAHEKGGVEGQVGYLRRARLTPVPAVQTLTVLNAWLIDVDDAELSRRIGVRPRTIGEDFAREAGLLAALPDEPFTLGVTLTPRVDRYSMITVRMNRYSVPARLIGRKVRVVLDTNQLTVYDARTPVATHPRLCARGEERLVLDHFLEILLRKPGALAGSEALDQARRDGSFTPAHEAFWAAARAQVGDPAATRALVAVLLLHRHLHPDDVHAGITAALTVGAATADLVAVEARKAAQAAGRSPTVTSVRPPAPPPLAPALPTTRQAIRRVAELPGDRRALPDLTDWDHLLRRSGKDPP